MNGCGDVRCPVCNPIATVPPHAQPRAGAPSEPLDEVARSVAREVASTIRDALEPTPLTVEQRLDALELEIERLRVQLQRVGESHANSLEGAR